MLILNPHQNKRQPNATTTNQTSLTHLHLECIRRREFLKILKNISPNRTFEEGLFHPKSTSFSVYIINMHYFYPDIYICVRPCVCSRYKLVTHKQGLSQGLETERPKLANVKFLGVHIFKGNLNILNKHVLIYQNKA